MKNKINIIKKYYYKHFSIFLEYQNFNILSNIFIKYIKKLKFNAITSSSFDIISSFSEILDEIIEYILDIQNQVFIIFYYIILRNISIKENMKYIKFDEFKYKNFEVQMIKIIDKMIIKVNYNFK